MTNDEIKAKALAFGDWYHEVELFPGFTTPSKFGGGARPQWESTAKVRKFLDYKDKTVLDMGTMDGYWAFGAEALGAKAVYAIDICQGNPKSKDRFALAAEALNSKAQYFPCNAHMLKSYADSKHWPKFDIVQCLGLLYHVQNPMLVLNNIAACLKDDGKMLFEGACIVDESTIPWMRFNFDLGIYYDKTTFCCPNWIGLWGMLDAAGFEPEQHSKSIVAGNPISRMALIAHRNGKPLAKDLGMA